MSTKAPISIFPNECEPPVSMFVTPCLMFISGVGDKVVADVVFSVAL